MARSSPFPLPWLDAIDARWPGLRRHAGPIALTALIEIVLLYLLLSLGIGSGAGDQPHGQIVTTFNAVDAVRDRAAEPEEKAEPAPAAPSQSAPAAMPSPSAPQLPLPVALPRTPTGPPATPAAPVAPVTTAASPADAPPSPGPSRIRAVVRSDMGSARGPADTGSQDQDSERIPGSGPNGEPLYAARWYREPNDDEYRGYFSRVTGSSWALINCRTEPQFRVDHCVLVGEWPERSGVGSAVLAMAWQFRVRPPRVGGRSMVGEWVRIKIEYTVKGP